MDKVRDNKRTGSFVEGVVVDWRGTYGFLQVQDIGSVFIHKADVAGRPFIQCGSIIRCQVQQQVRHPRPKAVQASLVTKMYLRTVGSPKLEEKQARQ